MTVPIDLTRDGKQRTTLYLQHSSNQSAYGAIPVPIAVVSRGTVPTVLLTAGAHGDEYEGQVALARLARELDPEQVTGRIIILPTLNPPAALAGLRLSPIDGGNLNRCYPGNGGGGPTDRIARLVEGELLPLSDAWVDLHSGGASLDSVPCVNVLASDDVERDRRSMELARAFGAPLIVVYDGIGGEGTSLAAARRNGIAAINTEMGGGARLAAAGLDLAWSGVLAALATLGAIPKRPRRQAAPQRTIRIVPGSYLYAPDAGVIEHCCGLGGEVAANAVVARLHSLERPFAEPVDVRASVAGIVAMNRPLARVEAGDCIALICPETAWGAEPKGRGPNERPHDHDN